jgi:hypothetical protein
VRVEIGSLRGGGVAVHVLFPCACLEFIYIQGDQTRSQGVLNNFWELYLLHLGHCVNLSCLIFAQLFVHAWETGHASRFYHTRVL